MIIQRYMDFSKFESLLQTKSLFLAKMASFDDKLEGGITASDFFAASNALRILDVAINHTMPGVDDSANNRNQKLAKSRELDRSLRAQMFQSPFGEYPSDDFEELYPICREWMYVNCWHKSDHECYAMWNLYAATPNALCIFTTTDNLKSAIKPIDSFTNVETHPVSYIKHGSVDLWGDPIAPFLSKSMPYTFEREYRVIAWNSHKDLYKQRLNSDKGMLLPVRLETLIEKVVLSPFATEAFKNQVIDFCLAHSLQVQIVDSELKNMPVRDIYDALALREQHQT